MLRILLLGILGIQIAFAQQSINLKLKPKSSRLAVWLQAKSTQKLSANYRLVTPTPSLNSVTFCQRISPDRYPLGHTYTLTFSESFDSAQVWNELLTSGEVEWIEINHTRKLTQSNDPDIQKQWHPTV
ncbi:MAG: hypothetical protein NZ108_08660, partial [Bacteroidia bacterium]|nr:hypothetical protein [Bacteroidia bacterium]